MLVSDDKRKRRERGRNILPIDLRNLLKDQNF